MRNLRHKLEHKKIISSEDVAFLREHICSKNPNLTENAKNKIISKAIIKVLDKEFFWLPKEYRIRARKNLLMIFIKDDKNQVNEYDALKAVYKIAIDTEYESLLCKWISNRMGFDLNIIEISELFSLKFKLINLMQRYRYATIMFLITFVYLIYYFLPHFKSTDILNHSVNTSDYIVDLEYFYQNELYLPYVIKPFDYKIYNYSLFKEYLSSRESKLVEADYFQTIVDISREYDLDPLLLFAIIGQEQSFVPKNNIYSNKIINNPYNVFNSWRYYNTSLTDTTKIACYTLNRILSDLPEDEEPFKWINKTYAEDEKWAEGVRKIYNTIKNKYVEIY